MREMDHDASVLNRDDAGKMINEGRTISVNRHEQRRRSAIVDDLSMVVHGACEDDNILDY